MAITSRDITSALRTLFHQPVVLSTSSTGRDEAGRDTFTVRLPHPAAGYSGLRPDSPDRWQWTNDYLSRHLGTPVTITNITRGTRFTRISMVEGAERPQDPSGNTVRGDAGGQAPRDQWGRAPRPTNPTDRLYDTIRDAAVDAGQPMHVAEDIAHGVAARHFDTVGEAVEHQLDYQANDNRFTPYREPDPQEVRRVEQAITDRLRTEGIALPSWRADAMAGEPDEGDEFERERVTEVTRRQIAEAPGGGPIQIMYGGEEAERQLADSGRCIYQTGYGLPHFEYCGQPANPDLFSTAQEGMCDRHGRAAAGIEDPDINIGDRVRDTDPDADPGWLGTVTYADNNGYRVRWDGQDTDYPTTYGEIEPVGDGEPTHAAGLFDGDPRYEELKEIRDSGYDGPVDQDGQPTEQWDPPTREAWEATHSTVGECDLCRRKRRLIPDRGQRVCEDCAEDRAREIADDTVPPPTPQTPSDQVADLWGLAAPAVAQATARPPAARPGPTGSTTGNANGGDQMTTTGESYTHRAWLTHAQTALGHLRELQAAADAQLAALTAQNAGHTQIEGTQQWLVIIGDAIAHGERLIDDVDTQQRPVGEAVASAGGVDEVTDDKTYYGEGR